MKVLDIDLDFFLEDCCPLAEYGKRPELLGHEPWSERAFRMFLMEQCGLSTQNKTRGRIFQTHDMALQYWEQLIKDDELCVPFDIIHIDAHSDLGIGKPGPGFVLNTVLSYDIVIRVDIEKYYSMKQLDEANYLLFAIAFRWASSVVNVRNRKSLPDIPREISHINVFGEYDSLRLSSPILRMLGRDNEPIIPFTVYNDYAEFSDTGADFASLAISPRYSPQEADKLAEIFSEYILAE